MSIIRGYPDNSDISLLDVRYRYPKPDENGKWRNDWLSSFLEIIKQERNYTRL